MTSQTVAGTLALFTEQRAWRDSQGRLRGVQPLTAYIALRDRVPTVVYARPAIKVPDNPDSGHELFPGALGVLIGSQSIDNQRSTRFSLLQQIAEAVRKSAAVGIYTPGVIGTMAGIAAATSRRPLIAAVVGNPYESLRYVQPQTLSVRVARLILPRTTRFLTRRAIALRYVTSEHLQKLFPPGSKSRAYSATDTIFPPLGNPRSLPPSRPIRLITVTSMEQPYKGIPELITAVARCRAEGQDLHLTIVGSGRLSTEYLALGEATLPGHFTMAGPIYGKKMQELVSENDAFVLASYTEGMPRALLEAMAQGLPCVATNVGGIPEVLDGVTLAQPRNVPSLTSVISNLVSNPKLWRRQSELNLKQISRMIEEQAVIDSEFADAVTEACNNSEGTR